ncbi:MAG: ankyrin repeat domain-containing protein, partial [Desulfovibrionaceae bacterium]|nr:ankyrin repeat domain-containing protein [Desulfovibrionaceae bacterium]
SQDDNKQTALMLALCALKPNPDVIRLLVNAGADINAKDKSGRTALHLAPGSHDAELAKILLSAGADCNAQTTDGLTPLMTGIMNRNSSPEFIQLLLDACANENVRSNSGGTARSYAFKRKQNAIILSVLKAEKCRKLRGEKNLSSSGEEGKTDLMRALELENCAEIVEMLLFLGESVNARDENGKTPLMLVSEVDSAQLLLKAGADKNARDRNGDTAIMHTVRRIVSSKTKFYGDGRFISADDLKKRNLEVLRCLLSAGADTNSKNKQGRTPLSYALEVGDLPVANLLLQAGATYTEEKISDFTQLMWFSAQSGKEDYLKFYLRAEANVNATDQSGWTALMWAIFGNQGSSENVDILIKGGADVNVSVNGYTPLMEAAEFNKNSDVMKVLLAAHANVNAQDNEGKTALIYAVQHNTSEIVALLLSAGADRKLSDKNGCTALHYARKRKGTTEENITERNTAFMQASKQNDESALIAAMLSEEDVNARDGDGRTALMMANNEIIAKALLLAGADVNAKDSEGKTALMMATNVAVIKALLSSCADVNATDIYGNTALMYAIQHFKYHFWILNAANSKEESQEIFDKNVEVFRLLLKAGANVYAKNRRGETALMQAKNVHNIGAVEVLQEAEKCGAQ